jgi:hypothetical protein
MEQGGNSMIEPRDFYTSDDVPDKRSTDAMWYSIQRSTSSLRPQSMLIRDSRSFLYGMAASIVLGLALVGAWTVAHQALENAQPTPLRLEQAYVSAIQEFERVVPSVAVTNADRPQVTGQLRDRQQQLTLINVAIANLRKETNGKDLSPLKRERLRGLYSQELRILQEMIEEGDIEL